MSNLYYFYLLRATYYYIERIKETKEDVINIYKIGEVPFYLLNKYFVLTELEK